MEEIENGKIIQAADWLKTNMRRVLDGDQIRAALSEIETEARSLGIDTDGRTLGEIKRQIAAIRRG